MSTSTLVEAAKRTTGRAPATVRLALLGYGRVGQAVAALARECGPSQLFRDLAIEPAIALVRDRGKTRPGPAIPLSTCLDDVLAERPDVVVDVLDGAVPGAEAVRRALQAGIPVVSANKTLLAEHGPGLLALARTLGVPLRYEAAVVAGVPFLGALARRPRLATPRRLAGILNGTSHFIAEALSEGTPFREALALAVARGYAEPDASADLSGLDAARKLTILARLVGCPDLGVEDVARVGLDAVTPLDVAAARVLGGVIRPVAIASFEAASAGAWVGPALIDGTHPAAEGHGVFNFVELDWHDEELPVFFAGPGAGPRVTAATILDDVIEVARGSGSRDRDCVPAARVAASVMRTPPASRWYLRIAGLPDASLADIGEALAVRGLTATRIARVAGAVAARTTPTVWHMAEDARDFFTDLGADVGLFPTLEAWHA